MKILLVNLNKNYDEFPKATVTNIHSVFDLDKNMNWSIFTSYAILGV